LAIGGFSLATVAEGKTRKRAAIPIMVNNSLLFELCCKNNRLAPNRRTDIVQSERILNEHIFTVNRYLQYITEHTFTK
jgi:hypothetical protein